MRHAAAKAIMVMTVGLSAQAASAVAAPVRELPAIPAPGAADLQVESLALVDQRVTAATARRRACAGRILAGRAGVAVVRETMPATGVVSASLSAPAGDWDVAVFDAGSRRLVAGSAANRSNELATGWAGKGDELLIQACRRKGGSSSAALDVIALPIPTGRATGPAIAAQLVRVFVPSRGAIPRLEALGLDVTEHVGHDYVEVVTYGPRDVGVLEATGYRTEVVVADLTEAERARAIADSRSSVRQAGGSVLPSGRTTYRRLADYQTELKTLAEKHPGLVKPITLRYKTNEGRDVTGIEITEDVKAVDGKPVFFIMGAHHAREWPSAEHTMEFAHDLVNGFTGGDERIRGLLERARVIVVPIVNVDGFNVSREGAELGGQDTDLWEELKDVPNGETATYLADPFSAYRRRNCRLAAAPGSGSDPAAGPPTPPGACMLPAFRLIGTDPNRNYGSLWGGAGASAAPVYDTYRGTGPFSEPETQNIRDVVSKRHVTTLITNHTFSNLVLRPPGVKAQGLSPDEEGMKELGERMTAQNGYTNQPSWALYDTTGGTEDWTFLQTGGYGYTFEIGEDTFHPVYEDVVHHYLKGAKSPGAASRGGNREAYLIALENAADASKHSVVKGSAPAGTVLRLRKEFTTSTSPVRPFESGLVADPFGVQETETAPQTFKDTLDTSMTVGSGESFAWHVNPSTRPASQARRIQEDTLTALKVFSNRPPVGAQAYAAPPQGAEVTAEPTPPGAGHWERTLTITQAQIDTMDKLAISLDWKTAQGTTSPEDYDLVVKRDGTQVASAGATPGVAEYTEIEKPALVPGTYTFEIVNFAAAGQAWDLTLSGVKGGRLRTEPGTGVEAWKFSCESPAGKKLYEADVVVARGGQWTLPADACGKVAGRGNGSGSGGKPDANPGTGGSGGATPDRKAPRVSRLKVLGGSSLQKALRGGLRVRVGSDEAAKVTVAVNQGKKRVAGGRKTVAAGTITTVVARFGKSARRNLADRRIVVLGVGVTLVDAAGNRSRKSATVKLKRK